MEYKILRFLWDVHGLHVCSSNNFLADVSEDDQSDESFAPLRGKARKLAGFLFILGHQQSGWNLEVTVEAALADCIVSVFSRSPRLSSMRKTVCHFFSVRDRRISRAKRPRANFRFSREADHRTSRGQDSRFIGTTNFFYFKDPKNRGRNILVSARIVYYVTFQRRCRSSRIYRNLSSCWENTRKRLFTVFEGKFWAWYHHSFLSFQRAQELETESILLGKWLHFRGEQSLLEQLPSARKKLEHSNCAGLFGNKKICSSPLIALIRS